jgi:hypothetical protein
MNNGPPCIVLTGLGYRNIVGDDAEEALCELRNQVEEVPEVYRQNVPITYGMKPKSATKADVPQEKDE